jgi:ubiquinone/menaquinone biosynthesis C-methylase UbiE
MEKQLDYGNWIRKKNLLVLGLCTLGAGLLIFIPFGFIYHFIIITLFVLVFVSFLLPLYAYVMFSQKGGKFQEKIYNLLIQSLGTNVTGRILDIGSGNGVLDVKLALQHSEVEIVGIDFWGKDWEYSKSVCEKNAETARVESRVYFQKGDAASLDFASETFDGVISNLTFHEVKSAADKRAVVREALRVLKHGGVFAFVDYFYDTKYYGKASEFENYLTGMKLSQFEYRQLRDMISMPVLMRHPKFLGKVGIIYGRK